MSPPAEPANSPSTSFSSPSEPAPTMPGISLGLQRITRLLTLLHSPHLSTPIVHIAGTNGKGSVAAYLGSMLSSAEPPLRVGMFNSPHLLDEWDCIRLPPSLPTAKKPFPFDPVPVSECLFRTTKASIERLSSSSGVHGTSFEILTATAFLLFARADPPLDLAVVEVGLGGAEDATNVVPADKTLLSVVAAVELDHQKILGDTVGEIATVKGGITREGGDVVLAQQAHPEAVEAVKRIVKQRGATVWEAGVGTPVEEDGASSPSSSAATLPSGLPPSPLVSLPLLPTSVTSPLSSPHPLSASSSVSSLSAHLPLPGTYQLSNASTALLAAHLLRTLPRTLALVPGIANERLTDEALRRGIERTKWEGRLSWTSVPSPLPLPLSSSSSSPTSARTSRTRTRSLLLDGAHNPSSALTLSSYLHSLPHTSPSRPRTLIFALSAPRTALSVLPPLLGAGVKRVVCTGFAEPAGMEWVKAVEVGELRRQVEEVVKDSGKKEVEVSEAETAEEALRLLDERDGAEGEPASTLVAGSLYLVADVLRVLRRIHGAVEAGDDAQ
ncbi:hypothetical protein JCM8547_003858 [Rhodosporidiobolus lusitaniae]